MQHINSEAVRFRWGSRLEQIVEGDPLGIHDVILSWSHGFAVVLNYGLRRLYNLNRNSLFARSDPLAISDCD